MISPESVLPILFLAAMLTLVLPAAAATQQSPGTGHAESYLERMEQALELCRADIPAMLPAADLAAKRLADGGTLWCGGQPSLVSELCGRAGGLMMIKRLGDKGPSPGDVVLYAPEPEVPLPATLTGSGAYTVVIGGQGAPTDGPWLPNHAEQAAISPSLASAIPAWVFTGELVAALTRLGKMPVMYLSIGAYGGYARIRQYENGTVPWHAEHSVAPIAPGVLSNRFIDGIETLLRCIEAEQRPNINQAGAWAAEAHALGNRLFMYSMGHLFPEEVAGTAIGKLFHSAAWNAGFNSHKPPDDTYANGDFIVHIGYQQPPLRLLRRARPAQARVAYVAVRNHRDYVNDPGVIWIDPMWPWPDAIVPIDGYDIPIMPASGIVNGALAWEIYRLASQQEQAQDRAH